MRFADWVERMFEAKDDDLPSRVDAVIAIGTDLALDGTTCSRQSQAIAEKALVLFYDGFAKNIIVCGGYCPPNGITTEANAMGMFILDRARQVPDLNDISSRLFIEDESFRTFMNADLVLPIMQKHGWRSAIIVAQQWHARRAKATFKKRWEGKDIEFVVIKARAQYGWDNSQRRLRSFWRFAVWDSLAFIFSKMKGYC